MYNIVDEYKSNFPWMLFEESNEIILIHVRWKLYKEKYCKQIQNYLWLDISHNIVPYITVTVKYRKSISSMHLTYGTVMSNHSQIYWFLNYRNLYIISLYGTNISKLQEMKQLYSHIVQTICNEIPLTSSGTQSWIQVFIRTCTSAGSLSKQLM